MKTFKGPFTLLMVVISAFVMIYVVEGLFESRPAAALPSAAVPAPAIPSPGVLTRLRGLLKAPARPVDLRSEAGDANPSANQAVAEVHHGLCVAAMTGDLEKTQLLLDAGVSPDARDAFGIRAIARASLWGHHAVVDLLLKRGARVNERERLGVTLLMLAANQGDDELTNILLKYGADVNLASEDGETALSTALKKGYSDIADRLRLAGARETAAASVLIKDQASGKPAAPAKTKPTGRDLMAARRVKAGPSAPEKVSSPVFQPEAAAVDPQLLPSAMTPDAESGSATPSLDALTWAASISQDSIAVDEKDLDQAPRDLLPSAPEPAAKPSEKTVRVPARKSLPAVNPAAPRIETPDSIEKGDVVLDDILRDLKALTLDAPAVDVKPAPAALPVPASAAPKVLQKSPSKADEEKSVIKVSPAPASPATLKAPVPVRKPQDAEMQSLPSSFKVKKASASVPAARGRPAAVPVQPAPAPVRRKTQTRGTMTARGGLELLQAALAGTPDKVGSLLARGANVNARGELEMTPLMLAAQDGRLDVVQMLLDYGADVNAENIVGQTALRLATLKEHHDVMLALRKYGARD